MTSRRANAVRQIGALSRRSIAAMARQPQSFLPAIVFPLILVALNSAALERSTRLPGFPPVDSFVDFLLATSILHGVMIGSLTGGSELARDIEDGFFDRLLVAPAPRVSLLVGRLAGAAVFSAVQAVVFITVLTLFGASVKGGIAAVAVLVVVAVILGIGVGGLSAAVALRTGNAEAVGGTFPLIFILIFTSSAFFPRELMKGWFKTVATWNPLSWLIESMRDLVIDDFDLASVATALGVTTGIAILTIALSLSQLRRRLRVAA